MIKVGLTGGIGAGKSFAAQIFALLDIPIFYADLAARYIMVNDPIVVEKIKVLLGTEAYLQNGLLNKKYIGENIFKNDDLRLNLNKIVHPAVINAGIEWFKWQETPYALYESALLYEVGNTDSFDKIISVTAPKKLRIERVMRRDGITKKQVLQKIDKQMSQDDKDQKADIILINDGQNSVIQQVLRIHKSLTI